MAQGRASAHWRQSLQRGKSPTLFDLELELELERLAEEGAGSPEIRPGHGARSTDEGDDTTHAELMKYL